tara:strand:- start:409 stop:663 length:255 start_codon:yes stop_codon:yes gene_type:complete
VDGIGNNGGGSLSLGIARWKAVRGGTYQDGRPIIKPTELELAEIIDGICQRYSCLPSAVLAEDVGILRMLAIVSEGKLEDESSG